MIFYVWAHFSNFKRKTYDTDISFILKRSYMYFVWEHNSEIKGEKTDEKISLVALN